MNIFKKLTELNFPMGKYVVVGSGPLAARGLRESSDLDLVVTDSFWQELVDFGSYKLKEKNGTEILVEPESEELEILKNLNYSTHLISTKEIIDGADIIQGFPFLNIAHTIKIKTIYGREKDFRDIKLLEDYLTSN